MRSTALFHVRPNADRMPCRLELDQVLDVGTAATSGTSAGYQTAPAAKQEYQDNARKESADVSQIGDA